MTFQPCTCVSRAASSAPLSGDTPPRQGTHVLAARSDIVEVILLPAPETLSQLHCRLSELSGMRQGRARETEMTKLHFEECCVRSRDGKMTSSGERPAKKNARQVHSSNLR